MAVLPPPQAPGGPGTVRDALVAALAQHEAAAAPQQQQAPAAEGPVTRDAFSYAGNAKGDASCGDCQFFDGKDTCGLYAELTKKMPEIFSTDPATTAGAWCKAHVDAAEDEGAAEGEGADNGEGSETEAGNGQSA